VKSGGLKKSKRLVMGRIVTYHKVISKTIPNGVFFIKFWVKFNLHYLLYIIHIGYQFY
jgi:hypothetical protein